MRNRKNLLAVRVHPWQLYRFKRWTEHIKQPPSAVLQTALQVYFNTLGIDDLQKRWLEDYRKEQGKGTADEASLD